LKKCFTSLFALVFIAVSFISCGGKSATPHVSGFAYRAFVSNPLFPTAGADLPVLNVVNAIDDALSTTNISLSGNSSQPSMMALSPNLKYTAIFSQIGNSLTVVDNATETIATMPTGGNVPSITLPGFTESFFIASDNATAYIAIPSAAIVGQAPGAVVAVNITTGGTIAAIPVPAARYVVGTDDGTTLLVFSDRSDSVTVISTVFIGTNENPVTAIVPGFDRPVWAVFNGITAYVFSCGAECGGSNASISTFVPGDTAPGKTIPVKAATYGILNGYDLYVAGSPPGYGCSLGECGTLVTIDIQSLSVIQTALPIVNGYHNRMAISDDGQLFIGSSSCTNTNTTTGVPGCLSIYNTTNGVMTNPTTPGNVTGIAPIAGRTVVYVCQGGNFEIFSTTTDAILVQVTPTQIVGQSYDVKLVDPPPSPISSSPPNGN
jgi:hypothetical protein